MNVSTTNQVNSLNYEPSSSNGPVQDPSVKQKPFSVSGEAGRYSFNHPNDDYDQPGKFYRNVLSEAEKESLVNNICDSLGQARRDIQERQLRVFHKVDHDLAHKIGTKLFCDEDALSKI
jgi:catalase